jgi:hypothetical protein
VGTLLFGAAVMLAPMREGGPPRWFHIERRRIGTIFFEEMRKGWRLENLRGPPEFTLRPAFAGPVARAMTIFGWNVVRATTDCPRTALLSRTGEEEQLHRAPEDVWTS